MQLTVKQGDPAYDFGGRFVKQVDPYQGDILPSGFSPSDGCYWGGAPWPAPITSLDTPGLTWFVQSGPNGSYGPDYIGLNATFVGWIQNYAPAIQSAGSCKIQFPQKMLVSVDGGVVATETYGGPQSGLNLLVFTYTPTTVQVSRGSATGTRSFNY